VLVTSPQIDPTLLPFLDANNAPEEAAALARLNRFAQALGISPHDGVRKILKNLLLISTQRINLTAFLVSLYSLRVSRGTLTINLTKVLHIDPSSPPINKAELQLLDGAMTGCMCGRDLRWFFFTTRKELI
jgi:hypothetical protein